MSDRHLVPDDVAALLGCTRRGAFVVMRKAGGYELFGSMRIRREDLERWVDEQSKKASGSAEASGKPATLLRVVGSPRDAETSTPRFFGVPCASAPLPIPFTQPRRKLRSGSGAGG